MGLDSSVAASNVEPGAAGETNTDTKTGNGE